VLPRAAKDSHSSVGLARGGPVSAGYTRNAAVDTRQWSRVKSPDGRRCPQGAWAVAASHEVSTGGTTCQSVEGCPSAPEDRGSAARKRQLMTGPALTGLQGSLPATRHAARLSPGRGRKPPKKRRQRSTAERMKDVSLLSRGSLIPAVRRACGGRMRQTKPTPDWSFGADLRSSADEHRRATGGA
jgi:hypothetical protein